ncbi:MAG: FkbM family methyltransferase [Vicinamibacterales bacterium]
MKRLTARLGRVFGGPPPAVKTKTRRAPTAQDTARPDTVEALQEKIERLVAERRGFKERSQREHAKMAALAERAQGLDRANTGHIEQLQRFKALHARTHRGVLSTDVIRGLMRSRLGVAQHRAAEADARDRLARFDASSPSYAQRHAAHEPSPQLVRTTSDAVSYWIPALKPKDAEPNSPWLQKQAVPYRGILQTREVAIGGIMLDIGANIGHMSISRAVLGDVTAAYCAEPDALNYEALVRTIGENGLEGLVLPDRVAIGARTGTAHLQRRRFPGGHHIVDDASEADTVEVEMLTLDDWVRRHGIPLPLVTFIKVDVQGHEPQVLDGAREVLAATHIAWQMEVCPDLLREAGVEFGQHLDRLRTHFTHFTDLNKHAAGDRGRPTTELRDALAYTNAAPDGHTDLLLFNLAARPTV